MGDLPLERFFEISETVRVAERLEERRWSRLIAPLQFLLAHQNADPEKAPSYGSFLKSVGLDEDWEDEILGPFPFGETGRQWGANERPAPESVELDDNEWGSLTIGDLQAYKAQASVAELEKGDG